MNRSWGSLQVSYLLFLLMLLQFSPSLAPITKLMFIHIACDFLSTHIKCFLLFPSSQFLHDHFCLLRDEKTNKLINIQSFDGQKACRAKSPWSLHNFLSVLLFFVFEITQSCGILMPCVRVAVRLLSDDYFFFVRRKQPTVKNHRKR